VELRGFEPLTSAVRLLRYMISHAYRRLPVAPKPIKGHVFYCSLDFLGRQRMTRDFSLCLPGAYPRIEQDADAEDFKARRGRRRPTDECGSHVCPAASPLLGNRGREQAVEFLIVKLIDSGRQVFRQNMPPGRRRRRVSGRTQGRGRIWRWQTHANEGRAFRASGPKSGGLWSRPGHRHCCLRSRPAACRYSTQACAKRGVAHRRSRRFELGTPDQGAGISRVLRSGRAP
jgi:hypothetical protein